METTIAEQAQKTQSYNEYLRLKKEHPHWLVHFGYNHSKKMFMAYAFFSQKYIESFGITIFSKEEIEKMFAPEEKIF